MALLSSLLVPCYLRGPLPANGRTVITQQEFDSYATQGYNRIPVAREVLSDLDTPLSVYLKLADGPYAYLFE